jgi:hypothetical protein
MICLAIDNPSGYEIHAVILFFHARNMSAAEIHVNYARFRAKI